jgi:hypothetical protein
MVRPIRSLLSNSKTMTCRFGDSFLLVRTKPMTCAVSRGSCVYFNRILRRRHKLAFHGAPAGRIALFEGL